jgi:hypothetical protein
LVGPIAIITSTLLTLVVVPVLPGNAAGPLPMPADRDWQPLPESIEQFARFFLACFAGATCGSPVFQTAARNTARTILSRRLKGFWPCNSIPA